MSETELARILGEISENSTWLIGILIFFALIGLRLWKNLSRKQAPAHPQDPLQEGTVRPLFQELVCYLEKYDNDPRRIFLRSLTPHKATMLTTDPALQKGMTIRIDLSPILEHRSEDELICSVTGRIIRAKSIGGSPENFLINVQFVADRSWASHAIQRYLNESINRFHGKSQQLEVL